MQVPRPRERRGASGVQGRRAGTDSAGRPAGEDPEPVMTEVRTPSVAYQRPGAFPYWQVTAVAALAFLCRSMVSALWLAPLAMG